MKKNLNIKPLAKGMRVEDKARLIFADRNKRGDTAGREGLLTPEEEKALIDDAQDLRQISELNRLNRLFNASSFMMLDIQTAYLNFKLAEGRLLAILTGMILVGEANDAFDWVVYDFASQEYKDEELENRKLQVEVDKKAKALRKKYKADGLSKIYDYFEPSLRDSSYFSIKDDVLCQPNPLFQQALMRTVEEVKAFNKQIYQHKHVELMAGMEFMSDKDKVKMAIYIKDISEFVSLDGHLALVKVFTELADKGMLRTTNLTEPKFFETIKDIEKATRLSKKDKEKAEKEIEQLVLNQPK